MRLLMTTCFTLALALAVSTPAFAETIAQKQAEADRVEAQIESLSDKAEIAAEKYNDARDRYDSLAKKVKSSNAKIKKLKSRTKVLQTHLDTRANEMYRQGPMSFVSVLLSVDDFEELDATVRVLTSLNQNDASTVAELKRNKAEEAATNASLVSAKRNAAKQQKAMAANEKTVNEQLDARERVLEGLNGEVKDLIAKKRAADAAAAHARYLALVKRQRAAAAAEARRPKSSKRKSTSSDTRWQRADEQQGRCSGLLRDAGHRQALPLGRLRSRLFRLQRPDDVGVSEGGHLAPPQFARADQPGAAHLQIESAAW